MDKIFCPNCGTKHEFKFAAPKFCSQCGAATNSMSGTIENAEATPSPARPVGRVNRVTSRLRNKGVEDDGIDLSIDVDTTLDDIERLSQSLGEAKVQSTNSFETIQIGVPKSND